MTNHSPRSRWVFVVVAALIALAAAGVAYNIGLSQGAAGVAALQNAPPPAPGAYPYPYGWHRPWGFGFPFFGVLLLFLLFRGFCWGGPWRHRGYYYYDERDRAREGPPADDSARR